MSLKADITERLRKKREEPTSKQPRGGNQNEAKVSKLATITAASVFVAAACLLFAGVTNAQTSSTMASLQENLTTVAVAQKNIPQGAVIKESMVGTMQVPQAYVSEGAITDITKSVGKQAVVRIEKNSQLRTSELTGNANTSSLSGCLEKGMKAVSIDVSTETDFAKSLLHQGDRVSLYCFRESDDSGETKTTCLAEDVPVLALDGFTSYEDLAAGSTSVSYSNVSVEVDAKTAAKIRKTQSSGTSIWMVLSASVDNKR